jgi:hypothetical protein
MNGRWPSSSTTPTALASGTAAGALRAGGPEGQGRCVRLGDKRVRADHYLRNGRSPAKVGVGLISGPPEEGTPTHAIARTVGLLSEVGCTLEETTMPDPLPKPPGRAPGEPIIIKNPPPPPEIPAIDGSLDEEDDPEIKKPPEIVPENPTPPAPWDRPDPGWQQKLLAPPQGISWQSCEGRLCTDAHAGADERAVHGHVRGPG